MNNKMGTKITYTYTEIKMQIKFSNDPATTQKTCGSNLFYSEASFTFFLKKCKNLVVDWFLKKERERGGKNSNTKK